VFEDFAHTATPRLVRTAFLLTGDAHEAEDVVQEALIRTYLSWGRVRDPGKAEAYCRTVLVRLVVDAGRRRQLVKVPLDSAGQLTAPAKPEGELTRSETDDLLALLPPRQRACLVLRFYLDLSVPQTADLLRISEGTVKSQTHDALTALRRRAGGQHPLSKKPPGSPGPEPRNPEPRSTR
jgi:RNA polymerase sigma-70 factor (sigma-E family)